MLTITPKFTEKDVQNLLILLNEAVKAIGINSVREVTRIADIVQLAIDEAKAAEQTEVGKEEIVEPWTEIEENSETAVIAAA